MRSHTRSTAKITKTACRSSTSWLLRMVLAPRCFIRSRTGNVNIVRVPRSLNYTPRSKLTNAVAKGQTVDSVTSEVGVQVKWFLSHLGRITFDCKSLGGFQFCDDEEHPNNDAAKDMPPPFNPLIVSYVATAIRDCRATLPDIHSKRNEARILDAMHTQIYISRMQSAGQVVPPEVMARRVGPSTVESMGFTYAPEMEVLVEMVKQVLENTVEEIRKQAGGEVPVEGREGQCAGACRDLGMVQRRMLKSQARLRSSLVCAVNLQSYHTSQKS